MLGTGHRDAPPRPCLQGEVISVLREAAPERTPNPTSWEGIRRALGGSDRHRGQVSKDNWEVGRQSGERLLRGQQVQNQDKRALLAQRTTGCSGPARLWAESP